MTDKTYKIALHSEPVIVKSNSVILYKNQKGEEICIKNNHVIPHLNNTHIVNKNYIISLDQQDKKVHFDDSDELIISETESMILYNQIKNNKNVNIIYDLEINQYQYNVFSLTFLNDVNIKNERGSFYNDVNIQCHGLYKSDTLSYDLVLNHFVGLCVYCDVDLVNLPTKGKMFIVYSKKISHHQLIKIKNKTPYQLTNEMNELSYYPIFVICCHSSYGIEDFVNLYPYLVKNIFNYTLQ